MEGLPSGYLALPAARPLGVFFLFMVNTMIIEQHYSQPPIRLLLSSCGRCIQAWPARPA
jgi:hypothetical protein